MTHPPAGIATFTQSELDDLVLMAQEKGLVSSPHNIGDGAMEMNLNAIENAQLKAPRADMRHSLIHCQITDPEIIKRCRESQCYHACTAGLYRYRYGT